MTQFYENRIANQSVTPKKPQKLFLSATDTDYNEQKSIESKWL